MNDSSEIIFPAIDCPSCSSGNVRSRFVDTSFPYGQGESAVLLPVTLQAFSCLDCGLEYVDDSAEELKHDAVCRHMGVFTPAEVESVRNAIGMTRAKFAELTKIGEATLGRWERGALIQNSAYDQFLYLLKFSDNVVRLLNRELLQKSGNLPTGSSMEEVQSKFRGLVKSERLGAAVKNAATFRLHDPEAA